jgi:hypothetical protein
VYNALLKELIISDRAAYRNFLRMTVECFETLAVKVEPIIGKQDTWYRKAIPVEERLALTLRYLATGRPSWQFIN